MLSKQDIYRIYKGKLPNSQTVLEIEKNANFYEDPKEEVENKGYHVNDQSPNLEPSEAKVDDILGQTLKNKKVKKRKRLLLKKFKCQICDLKLSSEKNLLKHTANLALYFFSDLQIFQNQQLIYHQPAEKKIS